MSEERVSENEIPELEIFSDFIWLWCYFSIGDIEHLNREYNIKIKWRAFPLHPDIPASGISLRKMIGDFVDTDVAKKNSIKMANERGLPCCGMETIYNSKPAQELSAWAGLKNRGMAFRKAVFHACYGEGRNISDIGVLKEIAEAIELDPAEAEQVLKNRVYKDIVDHDWLRKNELALVAAPTYFIKGDRLVGCHPYEKMENFIVKNGAKKRND